MKTIFTRLTLCCKVLMLLSFVTFKCLAVTITSFSPKVGVPGSLITIQGTDLSTPTTFTIGNKPAIILSNTGTTIVAMVMPGATSGNITLTNVHGTAKSPSNFMLIFNPVAIAIQGTKLTGNDHIGAAAMGTDVAMSANSTTAIVGGSQDNNGIGAAWIFTANGSWQQQGHKLVGTDSVGQSKQGTSVGISADGTTAIIGGPGDNNGKGAVWVFTRQNDIWLQQGLKLTVSGTTGATPALFGASVSLSADGNTLVAEAAGDDNNIGAAYVFVRSNGVWAQQGNKLVATGTAADSSNPASSQRVAISADGDTFAMGANSATPGMGGVWVFTRTNTTWVQQGSKLLGGGAINQPKQGSSIAISADGNVIAFGGPGDGNQRGAAWIFVRQGIIWTQQGNKIQATGFGATAQQGSCVNLNADGKILMVGAKAEQNSTGAGSIFTHRDTSWQQFTRVEGLGASANSTVGNSAGMSADGRWGIVGGAGDNNGQGAAWVSVFCNGGPGSVCAPPKTTTLAATVVALNTAIINGTVDATGCYTTNVVFEYSTSADMSNAIVAEVSAANSFIESSQGAVSFNSNLTGLLPGTTYYYRIVAANCCTEITNGQTLSFTTLIETPGSGLSATTIPTAFSPNNDGINDKWEIPFLTKYTNCLVKVFNRSGQVVFSSTGYNSSWDGKYKNNDLPAGAYYYVIDLKNNQTSVSGSVNLVK